MTRVVTVSASKSYSTSSLSFSNSPCMSKYRQSMTIPSSVPSAKYTHPLSNLLYHSPIKLCYHRSDRRMRFVLTTSLRKMRYISCHLARMHTLARILSSYDLTKKFKFNHFGCVSIAALTLMSRNLRGLAVYR